ncbi:hypothetical protein WCN91_07310 [Pseudoalteromonas sp. YIC-827]|uniref:SMI1/KNR4 family protein n=1 Tax=Pseudoalteromonas qingdaonensis TaxID=3131913 RepID=A0ABU9MVB9_9GAMM
MFSSCFPVYEDQILEAEKLLGIKLPERYKELVCNEKVLKALTSKKCKFIDPSLSMLDFVEYSKIVKEIDPNFPKDAIVMFCPTKNIRYKSKWGYLRFWIPDKKNPGVLSNTIYSWDLDRGKKSKDCSVDCWLSSPIEVYYGRDKPLFESLGLALPEDETFIKDVTSLVVNELVEKDQDEWLKLGSMIIKGKWLTPCDLGQTPDSDVSPSLKVNPGKFDVYFRSIAHPDNKTFTLKGLRLLPEASKLNSKIEAFDIDIDVGSVCIFDRQSLFRQVSLYEREDLGMELLELDPDISIIKIGSSSEVLCCPAGRGDGTYKVYKLETIDNEVGLEIDFSANQP